MPEQILYEINGVKYVLIEVVVTDNNKLELDKIFIRYSCLYQGLKDLKRSFWGNGYVVIKWLVPESNIIKLNQELNSL